MRPQIQAWLELNAPEALEQLDFGDMVEPEAEAPAEPAAPEAGAEVAAEPAAAVPAEEPQMASDNPDERNKKDNDDLPFDPDDEPMGDKDEYGNTIKNKARHLAKKGMRQAMDVKELAEFITSFYDKESGTFPKGPEGVCTMVGKKFGEQAEQVARKFVERMAPHQEQGAEELAELGRMRELAGLQNEGGVDPNQHPQTKDYGTGEEDEDDQEEKNEGLEDIRRLSGIAQGLRL
jgi:hypothetical protein